MKDTKLLAELSKIIFRKVKKSDYEDKFSDHAILVLPGA